MIQCLLAIDLIFPNNWPVRERLESSVLHILFEMHINKMPLDIIGEQMKEKKISMK